MRAASAVQTQTGASRRERPPVGRTAATPSARPEAVLPEPVYRPDDERPRHDDAALARAGIRRYDSKRLILYSDAPAAKVERLPALVDAVHPEWVKYFGALPPARDGSEYQITGYLIDDLDRFKSAGLVPEGLRFEHGQHRDRRFWMRDQPFDYYRAHLLLHECTHCFMTALPGGERGPVWYMEGMAERFGTHRVLADGRVEFRIMPASPDETAAFGRITLVRREVAAGRLLTLDGVAAIPVEKYTEGTSYAWWWAACCFLDSHPRYRDRFRELGDPRLRRQFRREFVAKFAADAGDMNVEWALFAQNLRYAYDIDRAVIDFRRPDAKPGDRVTVGSDRGWQSSEIHVEAGKSYEITAEGRVTLADGPRPWSSDPAGISFDYFDGKPLGLLRAAVLDDATDSARDAARGLLSPIDVGRRATFTAPADGVLYFRINDGWDRLADNEGSLSVTVRPGG